MSISNASSKANTSSTSPSESAPKSSMKVDSGLMSFSSTSSCSLMIRFTSTVTLRPSAMIPPGAPLHQGRSRLHVFLSNEGKKPHKLAGENPENQTSRRNPRASALGNSQKLHVHSAVDSQRLAGHVGSFVGGQVGDGGRDFARGAGP